MTTWRLIFKEAWHRKVSFLLALAACGIAAGTLTGELTLLRVHDLRTQELLTRKEAELQTAMQTLGQDMRKATLKLSFNLVILPKDQNLRDWYADDFAAKYMPEEYVTRLADSGIVTVRHFLPSLQQRLKWPEKEMTIILVGTRGEVPNLHKNPVKPLVQPVAPGTVVLGHELHQRLQLEPNDTVKLLGREFRVAKCHAERGNKDDITAWVSLGEAQKLLDKEGLINAILALECLCVGKDGLPKVRAEIQALLPDTQVIERGSKALARAESRMKAYETAIAALSQEKVARAALRAEREQTAGMMVALVFAAAAVWIALISVINARERTAEIGVLRTLGCRSRQIVMLVLARAAFTGLAGGILGLMAGQLIGARLGATMDGRAAVLTASSVLLTTRQLALGLLAAPLLAVTASWIPALKAAQQDPADTLREAS